MDLVTIGIVVFAGWVALVAVADALCKAAAAGGAVLRQGAVTSSRAISY